jgi:hypothetical protein
VIAVTLQIVTGITAPQVTNDTPILVTGGTESARAVQQNSGRSTFLEREPTDTEGRG